MHENEWNAVCAWGTAHPDAKLDNGGEEKKKLAPDKPRGPQETTCED